MVAQSSYPVVLIPQQLQDAQLAKPDIIPEYPVQAPQHPGDKPKAIQKGTVATQSALAVLPSVMPFSEPKFRYLGWGTTFICVLIIATKTIRQWLTGKNYQKAAQTYHLEMPLYQDDKRQYETEAISSFQLKLVLELLSQTHPPDGNNSQARRGVSEPDFEEVLHHYFPDQIQAQNTLDIPDFKYPYSPDFTYVDRSHNLHIDIEVDEPYRLRDYAPTHYLHSYKETRRNNFFLDKGWLVIRFSEEQVIRWPDSCCKAIAEVIAEILGNEIPAQFQSIQALPEQTRWTKQEAIAFANQSIRKDYRAS